jgi:hypothetical protein
MYSYTAKQSTKFQTPQFVVRLPFAAVEDLDTITQVHIQISRLDLGGQHKNLWKQSIVDRKRN